jgi:hypothetical protein
MARVLVIDDDKSVCAAIEALLRIRIASRSLPKAAVSVPGLSRIPNSIW